MQLFVGLGNPGEKYAQNRHNVGFMLLDRIAQDHDFSPWRAKFDGQISEGQLGREKIVLLKPETFMNNSGQSVGKVLRFFKLDSTDVTVFQDEIDLERGKCRVKNGGGHAGHNGLRSIHQHIGPHYSRVRIGVGHPGAKGRVAKFLLHDFAKADQLWLADLIKGVSDGVPHLAADDASRFMNTVALNITPPRASKSAKPAEPGAQPSEAADIPAPVLDGRSSIQKLIDRFR